MKIAYILPSLSRSGPNIVVHSIVCSDCAKDHDIVVYYFDELNDTLKFPCTTKQISQDEMIDFEKFDIVHSNMLRPDRYVYNNRKRIKKVKLVTTIHQDIFKNLTSSYNILVAACVTPIWLHYITCFDAVVPISNTLKLIYKNRLNNLSDVIYNGVNVYYQPSLQDNDIRQQILQLKSRVSLLLGTYAQITYLKGIDQIIDAVANDNTLGAVIIGEGNAKKSLQEKVEKMNLHDRVVFLPYLRYPYNYLELIDIYVMPSKSEGFGLAMVEAAFTKTPIVCSEISVFREIFDNDQASFFTLDDISSLSDAIYKVKNSYELYVNKSYNRVTTTFTNNKMAENYFNLYEYLLR